MVWGRATVSGRAWQRVLTTVQEPRTILTSAPSSDGPRGCGVTGSGVTTKRGHAAVLTPALSPVGITTSLGSIAPSVWGFLTQDSLGGGGGYCLEWGCHRHIKCTGSYLGNVSHSKTETVKTGRRNKAGPGLFERGWMNSNKTPKVWATWQYRPEDSACRPCRILTRTPNFKELGNSDWGSNTGTNHLGFNTVLAVSGPFTELQSRHSWDKEGCFFLLLLLLKLSFQALIKDPRIFVLPGWNECGLEVQSTFKSCNKTQVANISEFWSAQMETAMWNVLDPLLKTMKCVSYQPR